MAAGVVPQSSCSLRLDAPARIISSNAAGRLAFHLMARERRIALTNLDIAFGQSKSLEEKRRIACSAFQTFARSLLGLFWSRQFTCAKFDNLVHVAHNCDIGEDVILVALAGISGSCTVGKGAVIAGQVGLGDHVNIGPGVILGGQAGVFSGSTVTNDGLKPGTVHWGTPARPLREVLREQATLARLAKRRKDRDS